MYDLRLSQEQLITFVMVNSSGSEVSGLGASFTLTISKAGGAFVASAGTKAEVGSGWYTYELTASETDTYGPLSIAVNAAGCVQQNLEYVVVDRSPAAIEFTYTVTSSVTLLPVSGVDVWVTIDVAGSSVIWNGQTDAFGVALDSEGNKPRLDPGTYYFWSKKTGMSFSNPDTEIVS